jgi:hypothetical protein
MAPSSRTVSTYGRCDVAELSVLVGRDKGARHELPARPHSRYVDPALLQEVEHLLSSAGAFNIGTAIRWLDYNDCWLAAECT